MSSMAKKDSRLSLRPRDTNLEHILIWDLVQIKLTAKNYSPQQQDTPHLRKYDHPARLVARLSQKVHGSTKVNGPS